MYLILKIANCAGRKCLISVTHTGRNLETKWERLPLKEGKLFIK